jgi:hypothetical protein
MAGTETDTGDDAGRSKGPGARAGGLSVATVALGTSAAGLLTAAGLLGGAALGVPDGEAEADIMDGDVELTAAGGSALDGPSSVAETPPVPQPAAANRTAPTRSIRRTRLPVAPAELLGGIDSFPSDGLPGRIARMDAAGPVGKDGPGSAFSAGRDGRFAGTTAAGGARQGSAFSVA